VDVTSPASNTVPVAPPIVAIGASAGGVGALGRVVEHFDAELAAAVLVVLHVPPQDSALPAILARHCRLPVSHAVDGDPIEAGRSPSRPRIDTCSSSSTGYAWSVGPAKISIARRSTRYIAARRDTTGRA
jgi:hypothetical protein